MSELLHRYFDIAASHRAIPCKEYFKEGAPASCVVIGIHGFGGNKESPALALLAEALPADHRLLAIDLPAHGASVGSPLTVENCISDLVSAVEYAEKNFPHARIYTFATSFGGYINLLAEEHLRGRITKTVLRVPAVEMHKTLIEKSLATTPQVLENNGFAYAFNGRLRVEYSFYKELCERDIFALRPKTPTLMICATEDELVDYSAQVRFSQLNPQITRVDIGGAGHRFMGEGELSAAIESAVRFILAEKGV